MAQTPGAHTAAAASQHGDLGDGVTGSAAAASSAASLWPWCFPSTYQRPFDAFITAR